MRFVCVPTSRRFWRGRKKAQEERSEREFLYHILGEVIKAEATTLSIPDTVGITVPFELEQLIADIKENTPGIENVIISSHCHSYLGLASANAVHSARAGARQIECTINGIGERAGNTSLEEVAMILRSCGKSFGDLYTGIRTQNIVKATKMATEYSGLPIQLHKAIVGANAFKGWSSLVTFLRARSLMISFGGSKL